MDYLFTSERLGFRPWKESDILPFYKICSDSDVMEYFPSTLSLEETKKFYSRLVESYINTGMTFYALDVLKTSVFAGMLGVVYQTMDAPFTPAYEIGWRLDKAIWNKGYATEGALALLDYCRSVLKLEEVYAITAIQNVKSEHIMKKIGMTHFGFFNHPKLPKDSPLLEHTIYQISL